MMLFKSLAVSVLRRKQFIEIRKAALPGNLTSSRFFQLWNLKSFRKKSPNFLSVESTFCSYSKELAKDSAEDLLGEEDVSDPDEVEETTDKIFQEIAAGDPETLKKLKLLEFEVAVLREEECRVPDKLNKYNWRELLEMDSIRKRKKFLAFLRLNELKRISQIRKSESKRELWLKYKTELGFHYYGLSGHTMFMRIYEKDINKLLHLRAFNSKLEILLDCSYQEYMSLLNIKACAKQIFYTFCEARCHRYPCQLKICNLDREDALGKILPNYVKGIYDNFYADVHRESYLDLYPKEKLVYLTPHARTDLHKFNHDDIYIIGAFVDRGTGEKVSLAKAKEHNLRMARFPLDDYLFWKKGSKSLPLNTVMSILLDMAFYNDWNKAFKKIPSRFLTDQ